MRVIDLLGPMPDSRTISNALQLIKQKFAALHADKSVGEGKVQTFALNIMKKLTTLLHKSARIVEDTSTSGLLHTGASTKPKPDICVCDRFAAAPHLVSSAAATHNLGNTSSEKAAAFQMQWRLQQLKHSQPHRQKWFFVSLGKGSLELWLFSIDEVNTVGILQVQPS